MLSNFSQLKDPAEMNTVILREFLRSLHEVGVAPSSQARILSGIKSFYKFMLLEDAVKNNPAALLESPRLTRHLPDTLDVYEIDLMLATLDASKPDQARNKVI